MENKFLDFVTDDHLLVFKIKSKEPKVVQGTLLPKGYKTDNLKPYYLVIEIEKSESTDFNGAIFKI